MLGHHCITADVEAVPTTGVFKSVGKYVACRRRSQPWRLLITTERNEMQTALLADSVSDSKASIQRRRFMGE